MKLNNFEVSNFRSITNKINIELDQYTAIIGANNIGKSNLLNAIILSLDLIKTTSYMRVSKGNSRGILNIDRNQYIRERDFPFNTSNADKKHTIFKLTFILTEEEKNSLKVKYGLNLNKDITLKFDFDSNGATYDVIMRGIANKKYNVNKHNIAKFIAENLEKIYIPCIRTSQMSEEAFQTAFDNALTILDTDEEYNSCLEIIKNKQNIILEKLQLNIMETISTYIPGVTNVHYVFDDRKRRVFRNGLLYIDDGVDTALEFKGDGIKSLTAIALLSSTPKEPKNNIFCIEEPEAHLHAAAVFGIKKILKEASENSQIILSTHSPILIDKEVKSNNKIVTNTGVKKCKSFQEIKDILGIQLSEDLIGSEVILLVEGLSDERIIRKLLEQHMDIEE